MKETTTEDYVEYVEQEPSYCTVHLIDQPPNGQITKMAKMAICYVVAKISERLAQCGAETKVARYNGLAVISRIADDGVITSTWVGNQESGWSSYLFKVHGVELVFSPCSGPDGSQGWYVKAW